MSDALRCSLRFTCRDNLFLGRPERYCKFFLGEDNGLCLKSDECFNSSSCSGDHVCCDTGCSKMCAAPIGNITFPKKFFLKITPEGFSSVKSVAYISLLATL